ncbi:MAG: lipoate--protein ligase [Firmicutes bacterium]|nr:lipoate--protein ligase [Bacillota bacterium]
MIREAALYQAPSGCYDPFLNLAREEVLLRRVKEGQILLYLWQNQNTVVIGRNQNCYKECRVSLLESEGGILARRLSGGGAVFHDLGNLNYTFFAMREDFDTKRQTGLILDAVRSFGLAADATGRNDIEVNGRKISGNAYYLTKEACYQHGTVMIDVNADKIERYLQVDRSKLASKGVSSVRSRVMSLKEIQLSISVDRMKERIGEAFRSRFAGVSEHVFAPEECRQIEQEAAFLRQRYASNAWRYSSKADYHDQMDGRFSWGGVEIKVRVSQGRIEMASIYTDALELDWPQILENRLKHVRFEPSCIHEVLDQPDLKERYGLILQDIRELFDQNM